MARRDLNPTSKPRRPPASLRLALIADTHLRAGGHSLPEACVEQIRWADLVLHAGDVSTEEALEAIEAIGTPLRAVHGNVDTPQLQKRLPADLSLDLEGIAVAMVHDAGPAKGRLERLRSRYPDADLVVFGHSHMPLDEEREGFRIFNPGSPTQRRRAPSRTIGVAEIGGGRVELRHVVV